MRIISGTARGRVLKMPKGGKTRPAMDRVKSSLFSIIAAKIPGSRFLDLFAGSGNIGIEALSRGSEFAAFVDKSAMCCETIMENLQLTKLTEKGMVYREDCLEFIKKRNLPAFQVVAIDPPYLKGFLDPILDVLAKSSMFNETTLFVIERQKKDELEWEKRSDLELIDERCFGDTVLTFFKLSPAKNIDQNGDY